MVPDLAFHIAQFLDPNPNGPSPANAQWTQRQHALAGFYGWQRQADHKLWDVHKSGFTFETMGGILGDAPLSGGGLYTGMTAAHIAAEVALAALHEGDLSAERLSEYQRKWKEEIGRELERGYLIRKAYLRLSDKRLDALGRTLDRPEVKDVLSTGDIDFPSLLAPQIIKAAPKLLRFAPQVLRSMFSRALMRRA